MPNLTRFAPLPLLALAALTPGKAQSPAPPAVLKAHCLPCHSGGDARAGVRLDTDKGLRAALPKLLPAIQRTGPVKMPPSGPLPAAETAALTAWTKSLAASQKPHWAYLPVRNAPPPAVKTGGWAFNPIDAFVLARLETEGLKPAPAADRVTLIRRVTFDLTGLPPTPEEVDAFLADTQPGAYERIVDRLLASPAYGERWGRHWLDIARFAESDGFEYDRLRPNAWPYRDWVIDSLNDDKPYFQFVREQLAGDVLPTAPPDAIAATGFLVAGPFDQAGSGAASPTLRAQVRENEMEDLVGTVAQTFLGLTAHCARCHDHKFDPIPQTDYYRLKSCFDAVRHGEREAETAAQRAVRDDARKQADARIAALDEKLLALDRAARLRLEPGSIDAPAPLVLWNFAAGPREGELKDGARIENGRLILSGEGAHFAGKPLDRTLREKTLEAFVVLRDRAQRGGGVLTIQKDGGAAFDAIVFAEQEPGRWTVGSESFRRTRPAGGGEEDARPDETIHVAYTYRADGTIAVFRNGQPYGKPYRTELQTFPRGSQVLIGQRHTGGGMAFLKGDILDARLYDRALTPTEVEQSYRRGARAIPRTRLDGALTLSEHVERMSALEEREKIVQEVARLSGPARIYAARIEPAPPTKRLTRGDVNQPAETVAPGGLSAIPGLSGELNLAPDAPEAERRRRLADWIARPDNPLTTRVIVNRLWQYHFGRGLVATPSDFGINGEAPTHPELLDWLAAELVRQGGRLKPLHRAIVLSATYRQSARFDAAAARRDADDRLLWRFPPRRLEAEALRDGILAVSGRLNPEAFGPSFQPFTVTEFNAAFYHPREDDAPELCRRTVYRMNVHSGRSAFLDAFDCPDPSTRTPRRSVTTTAVQALELMNDAFTLTQAKRFAERLTRECGADVAKQIKRAYRLAFCRPPTPAEAQRAADLVRTAGLESLCWTLFNANEFQYLP